MLSKTDAEGVRATNRRVVINHVRDTRVSTRRMISQSTGLSVSSASAIAATLIRDGILLEQQDDQRGLRRGRPERHLRFNPVAAKVAAVKIAVGEISVRISDFSGDVLGHARTECDIAEFDARSTVLAILDVLQAARARLAAPAMQDLNRMVVAVQGKTDPSRGLIVWSPAMRHRNLRIGEALAQATGAVVEVCNDCSLMPEGIRATGHDDDANFALVFIGFGAGMGLRVGGRTLPGLQTSAVEFGHINHIPGGALCRCGNRGCTEAYAGDYAIWRRARNRPDDEVNARRVSDSEMHALADEARNGEGSARDAFNEAGTAIGYGLGRIFTLIDPLPIMFTGAGAHAMDLLEPAIRTGIAESSIDGHGADVKFSIHEDVDALVFDAATNHALAALDAILALGPSSQEEAFA